MHQAFLLVLSVRLFIGAERKAQLRANLLFVEEGLEEGFLFLEESGRKVSRKV
jgi:hypothetical protein